MLEGLPPMDVTRARAVDGRRWPSVVRKNSYSAKPHPLLNQRVLAVTANAPCSVLGCTSESLCVAQVSLIVRGNSRFSS